MPLERSVKLHISAYIWLVLPCRMPKCTCSGLWVSGSISFARLHEIYGNLFVFIMSAFPLFLACFPFVKSRRCPLAISISYMISVFSFPLVSFFFFFSSNLTKRRCFYVSSCCRFPREKYRRKMERAGDRSSVSL